MKGTNKDQLNSNDKRFLEDLSEFPKPEEDTRQINSKRLYTKLNVASDQIEQIEEINSKTRRFLKNLSEFPELEENVRQINPDFIAKLNAASDQNEQLEETQINNEEMNNDLINNINNGYKDHEENEKLNMRERFDNNAELGNSNNVSNGDEEIYTQLIPITSNNIKDDTELNKGKELYFINNDKMDISERITQKSTGLKQYKSYFSDESQNIEKDESGGDDNNLNKSKKNDVKKIFDVLKVPKKFKNIYKSLNKRHDNKYYKSKKKKIIEEIKKKNEKENKKEIWVGTGGKVEDENKKKYDSNGKKFKLEDYEKPLFRKFKKYIKEKKRLSRRKLKRFRRKFKKSHGDCKTFWNLFLGNKREIYSYNEKQFIKKYLNFKKYNQKKMHYLFNRKDIKKLYKKFKVRKMKNEIGKNTNIDISLNFLRKYWDELYGKSVDITFGKYEKK